MKKLYESPSAEVINLAALARIALLDEGVRRGSNDDFHGDTSMGTDEDRA